MSRVVRAVIGVALIVAGVVTGNFQLILAGASLVGGAIMQPKGGKPRGAAAASLQIGEVPRQAIVGRAATPGSLVDAFNYGGKYGTDWEVLVIALADHRSDALEGFYVNDVYVGYAGDGMVAGYNNQLAVYFRNGTETQTVPAILLANGPGWTSNDNGAGVTHVTVAYKADAADAKNPIWPNGRPRFLWVLRGALCYDPRLDSTVGGVGAHRWTNPATWTWSDNPIVTRYKFARGFYACDRITQPEQLLVGRGLSAVEAPPANSFARANLCDEVVDGEPRYRVGGLIEANEPFIDVESDFAAACAGTIVQPEGAVEIDPGEARAAVVTITDNDLVVGSKVKRRWFLGIADREWVNSVVANYIEPSQKWTTHAAPVRRDIADIQADGAPREESLQLGFVSWAKQAGRVAEIIRRLGRLPIRAELVLPPRLCELEEGDWIIWQSDRYLKGQAYTFRVDAWGSDKSWQHSVVLRQISASCYSDTAPLTDGSVAVLQPPRDPIGAPNAANWSLAAGHLDAGSIRTPALIVTGAINDPSASFVRLEYLQSVAAPTGASVWSDAGVTGPDIKRREIAVAAGGTYWVAISYVVDGVPGDRLIKGPVVALAVTYPNGTPVENLQPGEAGATNDANLDDPTQLIINEKIRLVQSEPIRANRRAQVRARMVELGLSVAALDAAEVNWLAYRNSIAPSWDNVSQHSTINRTTWNTLSQAFDAALDAGDKLVSEEDARRALWSGTTGRPPLITATGITADETLRDPTVWEYSGAFEDDPVGGGRFRVLGGAEGYVRHRFENAVPIDHNMTYEGFWELYQSVAVSAALTSRFYTVVRCWDANGVEIAGDGTHWFYPLLYGLMPYGGDWVQMSARFGKGTARPFPANAARFGIGALLNLAPYGVNNTFVRNMKVRAIQSAPLKSAAEYNWVLGDGLAIRMGGGDVNWNNTAFGKAVITGPQRVTFKPSRQGAAVVAGLTDAVVPGSYTDLDAGVYFTSAGNIEIIENGSGMTGTIGTYTVDTEVTVEYDGLRLYYDINGVRQSYSSFAGQNRSFRFGIDCYNVKAGVTDIRQGPARTQAIVGGNTVDANGNPVYLDALRNNMALLDFWRRDASLPPVGWALNAEYNRIISLPTDASIPAPKAGGNEVWYCQETTGNSEQGGGWDGGQIAPIDKTRTYRFMVPVRRVSGVATSLWGIDGSSVCDLNTTTPNTNPYFVGVGPGSLQADRWYLMVGYVYPAGSAGHTNDQSGIYDCLTGEKVGTGTSYCWRAATSSPVTHRAYQYYATAINASQLFGRPVVNLIDGSEPSLREYFGDAAVLNSEQLWFDVSGIGRPQDYATSSDNMVKNGNMLNGGEDWNAFSSAAFFSYGAGSAAPVPAYAAFPLGTGAYIYANREQIMQLDGARTLFASGYSYKNGTLAGMSATINWYKADGSLSSITPATSRTIIPAATSAWESFLVDFVAPSDATQFQFNLSASGSNANACYVGGIRLSRTEPAADVTSTVTGSPEIVIECDHTGAPVAGQPGAAISPADKVALYKLFRNGIDITTQAAWSRTLISGSLTSSASTGALTISAIGSNEAIVRMTAVQGGSSRSMDVKVRKNLAPPPSGGSGSGGSSGGTSASDSTFTSTTTASHVVISDELSVTVGTGGNVILTAPLSFTITTGSAGNYGCYLRWQEWNGSAWVDVGSAEVESQFYASRYFDDALGANVSEPGNVTCNVTLTGRSGTKKYRLTARNGIGTTSVPRHYSGTATAQG